VVAGSNLWVAATTADLPTALVLDLAAGEGRNAIWLAERGWHAVAVDFSTVALERATRIAAERLGTDSTRFTRSRRTWLRTHRARGPTT
jgi:SAM-dependent methyltransferase